MTESSANQTEQPVFQWVVESRIDFPACLPRTVGGAAVKDMYLCLVGEFDGFVQLRPVDIGRATEPVFWTETNPIAYELRAGVRAPDAIAALYRGSELIEHVVDRLALLSGEFVRPLSLGFVYNEDQLRECIAGRREEYDGTTGGEGAFRTQPIRNAALAQRLLSPPIQAHMAIRWFRRGMTFREKVDQFVAFYIALESIAEHVPGITAEPRSCSNCGFKYTESKTNASIAFLIGRHPELPAEARQRLAQIRARILHGNADTVTLYNAAANASAVQRLAADGIALVLGVDPSQFSFSTSPLMGLGGLRPDIMPLLRARYDVQKNPTTKWGGLLSDVFNEYIRKAQSISPSGQPPDLRG